MNSLLTDAEKSSFDDGLSSVFWTFARPFTMFVEAQVATISTSPTYSRFGDHSQNSTITTDNTAVTPVSYTVTGCIQYGDKQPWEYTPVPGQQQDKIRESFGTVRVKLDATGHALMADVKAVRLDGFDFTLVSSPRPHGLVGAPSRWSYILQKTD